MSDQKKAEEKVDDLEPREDQSADVKGGDDWEAPNNRIHNKG